MGVSETRGSDRGPEVPRDRFAETVRLYSGPLFRYCYQKLGDRHLAEDAVQETFLRSYRSLRTRGLSVGDEFSGWLFGVARRCCLELLRKKRVRRIVGDEPVAGHAVAGGNHNDPASALLETALETLDDHERSLVYLKHVEGLKCRQIAERLALPVGTVTSTLTRSYRKLRRAMRIR